MKFSSNSLILHYLATCNSLIPKLSINALKVPTRAHTNLRREVLEAAVQLLDLLRAWVSHLCRTLKLQVPTFRKREPFRRSRVQNIYDLSCYCSHLEANF